MVPFEFLTLLPSTPNLAVFECAKNWLSLEKKLPGVASHLASTAFSFRSNSSAALTSPSACPCQGSAQRSHGCSTGKKNRRMWVDEPDVRRAGLSERQREMNVGPLLGISVFPAALLLP